MQIKKLSTKVSVIKIIVLVIVFGIIGFLISFYIEQRSDNSSISPTPTIPQIFKQKATSLKSNDSLPPNETKTFVDPGKQFSIEIPSNYKEVLIMPISESYSDYLVSFKAINNDEKELVISKITKSLENYLREEIEHNDSKGNAQEEELITINDRKAFIYRVSSGSTLEKDKSFIRTFIGLQAKGYIVLFFTDTASPLKRDDIESEEWLTDIVYSFKELPIKKF